MMKMIRNIFKRDKSGDRKKDALYELAMHSSSREKKKIIQKAARTANEEQRKIYYSPAATK